MVTQKFQKSEFLTYKEKPLVRCGNTIYYGSLNEKYVIKMQIQSTYEFKDINIANKIYVQLISTDPSINSKKKIVKSSEKENFYLALEKSN